FFVALIQIDTNIYVIKKDSKTNIQAKFNHSNHCSIYPAKYHSDDRVYDVKQREKSE
ncbi:34418_t:CDS:1, partial [Racocetra persica]